MIYLRFLYRHRLVFSELRTVFIYPFAADPHIMRSAVNNRPRIKNRFRTEIRNGRMSLEIFQHQTIRPLFMPRTAIYNPMQAYLAAIGIFRHKITQIILLMQNDKLVQIHHRHPSGFLPEMGCCMTICRILPVPSRKINIRNISCVNIRLKNFFRIVRTFIVINIKMLNAD